MKLHRLRVTMDPYHDYEGTILYAEVIREGKPPIEVRRVVPDNDFEGLFDYVWNEVKKLIDVEIARSA